MTKDEAAWEKREAELIKKLPKGMFEVRGLARSRYYSRLFQQGRDRPTSNEQFDEGFDAGFDVGYDAAITAEQKRVLAALEVEKRIANYGGTNYRSITQKAIDTAIEIVKGGDDD